MTPPDKQPELPPTPPAITAPETQPPVEAPKTLPEAMQEESAERATVAAQASVRDVLTNTFREPEKSEQTNLEQARERWRLMNDNENYRNTVERVKFKASYFMDVMQLDLKRFAGERASHVRAATALAAERPDAPKPPSAREVPVELLGYDASLRLIDLLGQVYKKVESPYQLDHVNPATQELEAEQLRTQHEFYSIPELSMLESMIETMQDLYKNNPPELLDLTLNYQDVFTMMKESRNLGEVLTGPLATQGFTARDIGPNGNEIDKLDPANPNYRHNLGRIYQLLSGDLNRSNDRRVLDITIGTEIIRGMSPQVRKDLMKYYVDQNKELDALELISLMVRNGVFTKDDAMELYESQRAALDISVSSDAKISAAMNGNNEFAGITDPSARAQRYVDDSMTKAEQVFKNKTEKMRNFDQSMLAKETSDSAASYFFQFNTLLLGRLAELGTLTALANIFVDTAAGWREGHTTKEKIKKAAEAFIKTPANPFVAGGAALAAGGGYLILRPYLKNYNAVPGQRELWKRDGLKLIHDAHKKHPGFLEFYSAKIGVLRNLQTEGKNEFGVTLNGGAIPVTEAEAKAMGFESAFRAKQKLIELYSYAHVLDINTPDTFKAYLKKNYIELGGADTAVA